MTPRELESLADEVFYDLFMELENFPSPIRRRGDDYDRQGRVGPVEFTLGRVSATVRGSGRYATAWNLSESGWRPSCTCPVAPVCKHAYALGVHVLDLLDSDEGLPIDLIGQLLEGVLPGRASTARHSGERPTATTRPPAQPVTFDQLREARSTHERIGVLSRLLAEAHIELEPAAFAAARDCLDEPDPEVMGWLLAHEIARCTGGSIPAPLEPFRDRSDLGARAAGSRRSGIEQSLIAWADRRTRHAERSLRVTLDLSPAPRVGCRVRIEPRLTTARMKDQPRSPQQLRSLQSQVHSNSDLLTREHAELLDALVEFGTRLEAAGFMPFGQHSRRGPLVELLHSILPSPDVSWSGALPPELAARGGVAPGALVQFDPMPVRLLPALEATDRRDEARLELFAVWPDGRRRPYAELIVLNGNIDPYSQQPAFVLSEGALSPVAECPPAEVLGQMAVTPSVAIQRRDGVALVSALARALPGGTEALASITAVQPVDVVVLLELHANDQLFIRVLAHSPGVQWPLEPELPASARVFEFSPAGRWSALAGAAVDRLGVNRLAELDPDNATAPAGSGPPSAAADAAWVHVPDPVRVAPVVEWLQSLELLPASTVLRGQGRSLDEAAGWVIRLGPRTVPWLAEAWQRRPAGVRWLGNRDMHALLGPGRSLVPRISARRHGVDLLAVSAEWEAEGLALTDADLARLRASTAPWVKLGAGWVRRDALEVHAQVSDVLADLGVEPGAGEQRLTLWQLAQARPESLEALERMGADPQAIATVRGLRERVAAFTGLPRCKIPKGFVGQLRPYQQQGLNFLAYTASLGMGAILADDMGLGKTVQALAWLLHLRGGKRKPGPALVVCPASVVHNWEREARQFAPELRVLQLGRGADRVLQMQDLARVDLVITNYALLRRDVERWREIELLAVIADEAQQIKNPGAAVSHAARALNASHRLALTGTPLENRALDLWSIVHFVSPGYLGDQASFIRRFDRADAPPHTRRLLTAKLRPLLLRRLKKDVAPELPDRIEERRDCEMSPGQRKLYLAELARAREQVERMAIRGGVRQHKIEILAALTRLRQICCHPRLAGGHASVGSGKFESLFELLEPLLAEGHKVLVFSQFVKAIELLQIELRRRRVSHHVLTGSTLDRPRVVRAFEQDDSPCVFLISLRAGGTGLNLTAASYVVLLDPWWNPAVEAQAIDRTHRIGQDRTVIAYRLLMQGTIEEKIWELQQRKGELVRNVLGEDGFARTLDRDALNYLFAEE